MSKFTFICEDEPSSFGEFGDEILTKRTVEFEASHLEGIIGEFETFLKGCGFDLKGYLDVVQVITDKESPKDDLDSFTESLFNNLHADHSVVVGGAGIDVITLNDLKK